MDDPASSPRRDLRRSLKALGSTSSFIPLADTFTRSEADSNPSLELGLAVEG